MFVYLVIDIACDSPSQIPVFPTHCFKKRILSRRDNRTWSLSDWCVL